MRFLAFQNRFLAALNQNLTQFPFTGPKPKQPMATIGCMHIAGVPKRIWGVSSRCTRILDTPNNPNVRSQPWAQSIFSGFQKGILTTFGSAQKISPDAHITGFSTRILTTSFFF